MQDKSVIYHQDNGVGIITIQRAKANAYDLAMVTQFGQALQQAEQDSAVNAVIVKSGLPKFFCAGADIHAFSQNSTEDNQKMVTQAHLNMATIESSNKIYIAQIAGHCLGGGLEIALSCDLRFAANGGYLLGLPEIKLGLIPGNGGTQRLVRLVGLSRALELLASGDNFNIEQAYHWGIVNRLYSEEELHQQTFDYALGLSNGPGLAIAATKKALREGVEVSLKQGLAIEQKYVDELYETKDANEGFLAFVEKRAAKFSGT